MTTILARSTTIPSQHSSSDLSINVFTSIASGKHFVGTITDTVNSWRHSIKVEGGFYDGAFSIRGGINDMEDWLENGLMRHVEVRNSALALVWEGFVNKITITYGAASITRGPIMNVWNKVATAYTIKDEETGTVSGSKQTRWKSNSASIARWGMVWERILNAGSVKPEEAERVRNLFLSENREPEIKQNISTVKHETNIVVDCLGYYHLLDKYITNERVIAVDVAHGITTTDIDISAKIKMVLAMDTNDALNYTELLTNPGFETAGGGGADVFAGWTESVNGDCTITRDTTAFQGSYACKFTTGASTGSLVHQTVDAKPSTSYGFAFSTMADGAAGIFKVSEYYSGGWHDIYPVKHTLITQNYDNLYHRVGIGFTTKANTTRLRVHLYSPSVPDGKSAWFDAVTLREYSSIAENTLDVDMTEKKNKTAWTIIKEILSKGDTSDNRWLFGVYENRTPHYVQAPTTFEYMLRMTDNEQFFTKLNGEQVDGWDIRPGKWVLLSDFLVGQSVPSDIKQDPRAMFIEEVRYSAGEGLTLNAGRVTRLSQMLGRLGITGISAG